MGQTTGQRIDPYGWSPTPTAPVQNDPWPYNQGYLWTTSPPSLIVPPPPPPPPVYVSGTLPQNTTWATGIVYVVQGSATVPAGATLTIQPGAIVKFSGATSTLNVYGTLATAALPAPPPPPPGGVPAVPIAPGEAGFIVTSIHDDSVGGDTNGNGSATSPAAGDYQGLVFYPGSTGTIRDAVIRYGSHHSLSSGGQGGHPQHRGDSQRRRQYSLWKF